MTDHSPPWDTCPKTIEGLIESSTAQAEWEEKHKMPVPYWWNMIVSRALFTDIATRLLIIEKIVKEEAT